MFIDADGPRNTNSDSSGRGEGYVPIAPPAAKDGSFWLWYTVNMTLATVCLVLNALLSTAMIVGREKTFKNSFYTIISLFAVTMVVSNICEIVCGIVVEGINMDAPGLNKASLLLDLIISYFSTILMFFLGLNRFAVFSSPSLNERLMNKKTLRYALSLSLLLSVAVSVVIFQLSSCKRVYESNVMVNYITNPIYMQVSNYVFYAIPLISSVFYLAVFNSLRHQRADAVSEKTKMLLDKAERCSLKQGTWILTGYLACLILHVVMQVTPPNGLNYVLLSRLQNLFSMAPQLAIPLSVFVCSQDVRAATMYICWSSIKRRVSTTFDFSRMHRVESASSSKRLPIVTLQSST